LLSIYVVAGLDAVRHSWSSAPGWPWLVGLALFLPGTALFIWSTGVNRLLEKNVGTESSARARTDSFVTLGTSAGSFRLPFLWDGGGLQGC
jgi:hypothetical protein